ncbi:hypothetical protein HX787_07850 [Pseudomonas tolaasii]|uniref:Uncharacterized protein n=2 Tax=Pseudomonas tolaasii TaxID=29442 RepID=A0A7Y8DQ09_PSETO|nr:hypothetical protein [Pseudomonas tolaasii]NWC20396.1 hypothetical protein [Pseudomonas tolaasii]NWC38401.1 hypothetical protein [Pseudomonas tolaasii]NWD35767.1 hypothetical protein [Pseudomonas tolaasii]NWE66592.1 hypothetical protein [Pseudomonas tolaasii]
MSVERVFHLEQALLAVLQQAEQQGVDIDRLYKLAIGGLIGNTSWRWVTADHVAGAADELESAMRVLRDRPNQV